MHHPFLDRLCSGPFCGLLPCACQPDEALRGVLQAGACLNYGVFTSALAVNLLDRFMATQRATVSPPYTTCVSKRPLGLIILHAACPRAEPLAANSSHGRRAWEADRRACRM
jgi:hypothetical protein